VDVAPESDVEEVEAMLVDEAKACTAIAGVVKDPLPVVHFVPGISPLGFGFTVLVRLDPSADRGSVEHLLKKRLYARLIAAKIVPAREPLRAAAVGVQRSLSG
jgi:hypothetical protein